MRCKTVLLVAAMALNVPLVVLGQSVESAESQPGTYSLLYSFQRSSSDGCNPQSGLVLDRAGNLYGTTSEGGEFGEGTVFELSPSGAETLLHSFAGSPSDGGFPGNASLTLDPAGNIYGTTNYGGDQDLSPGTVFEVTPSGTESILWNFTGGTDGGNPLGGLARDNAGNLYGTASTGGENVYDQGVVFRLTSSGTQTVLYNFGSSPNDGDFPTGNLALASRALYGTTTYGGATGIGTVFKLTLTEIESVLHSFNGYPTDGAFPSGGGLSLDRSGNLYGATYYGGTSGQGMVFKLTSAGAESVLLNFNGGSGGGYPTGVLAIDGAGNLYGTTFRGGLGGSNCYSNGCGVLFKLSPSGRETVLHDFSGSSTSDGASPNGVVRDSSGNLYGTLGGGGAYGCGAVFKYTP